MAKTKTPKKKPAGKKTAAKRSAKTRSRPAKKRLSSVDVTLSPKQQEKVLKKLRKMSLPASHPSNVTGPALELNYEAPMPQEKPIKRKPKKTAKKKK